MSKVMFITHSAKPSGAELSLMRLVKSMARTEAFILFERDGQLVDAFKENGIRVEVIRTSHEHRELRRGVSSVLTMLVSILDLIKSGYVAGRIARRESPDVIVARSTRALVIACVASVLSKTALVWSVHDRISKDYFGWFFSIALKAIGRVFADGYIANSKTTLSTIWTGRKPTEIVPPGIDLTRVDPGLRVVHEDVRIISMVGRLAHWKGQHVFLEAFATAFGGQPNAVDARIVGGPLFGEDAYLAELRDQAEKLQISSRVTFTGHVEYPFTEMEQADILVHASVIPEPFGAVVIEGMSAGCSVIATQPGGPAEVIDSGLNGILVHCNDAVELAAAMKKLASDFELRKNFSVEGPRRARDFDVKVLAERTEIWLRQFA